MKHSTAATSRPNWSVERINNPPDCWLTDASNSSFRRRANSCCTAIENALPSLAPLPQRALTNYQFGVEGFRMRHAGAMAGVLILVLATAASGQTAHAELHNDQGQAIGDATLVQTPHGVLMTVALHGVPPGMHAFHIHAIGKCEPPFTSAGGHFNPADRKHGIENPAGMHAGDLPNIYVPEGGALKFDVFVPSVSLTGGKDDLFNADGSSLVIHAGPDDYKSDPAGDAGPRIDCGVIVK